MYGLKYVGRGSSVGVGWDSSAGIVTLYGLDGPGIESRCGTIFSPPWGPPSLLYSGYRLFPGAKAAGAWGWPQAPSNAEVLKKE